jgi:hypothetical protein
VRSSREQKQKYIVWGGVNNKPFSGASSVTNKTDKKSTVNNVILIRYFLQRKLSLYRQAGDKGRAAIAATYS